MLKNLRIIYRDFIKNKAYFFINLSGLILGISIFLLLHLWVQDELNYDRYNDKSARIYRVTFQESVKGNVSRFATTPAPLGPTLVNEFPAIEKAVRFGSNRFLVRFQDKLFHETIFFTDPEIFDVFTIRLVKGDPKTVFKDPNSILISEEIKGKYFGDDDPVGKIITLDQEHDFKITGIFKKNPPTSHFRFDFLGVFTIFEPGNLTQWGISNYYTYILVSKKYPINKLQEGLSRIIVKYKEKEALHLYKSKYLLQSLTRIHLHSNLKGEIEANMDIVNIYIVLAVSLFILLIACFNYINLTTSKYLSHTKEVGLRKVLGAGRFHLVKRFLTDSFTFSFIALPFSIILVLLALPQFNSLSGKNLTVNFFNNQLAAVLVVVILLVGFIAGIFPALFISSLPPLKALKGAFRVASLHIWLRRLLVVMQFSISIVFIICVIIISKQLDYINNKSLGFDKEDLINIPIYSVETAGKYELIKNEFLKNQNIRGVTASSFFPGKNSLYINYRQEGLDRHENPKINCISVDHDFIKTYKMRIVEGRDFSNKIPGDVKGTFIINEAAKKEFGWKSPVGKSVKLGSSKGTIIGVVEDFHFKSLHHEIKPLVLFIFPELFEYFSVRVNRNNISQALQFLDRKWKELNPGQSFAYSFFEDDFNNVYNIEIKVGKIFTFISFIAIFIASIGLYGMSTFFAGQRRKEIGIRKVLGESTTGIILLLLKDFTKWVILANIAAWPIGWWVSKRWLQNFVYRINILPWEFFVAGIITLFIAILAVSSNVVGTSLVNPVKILREE